MGFQTGREGNIIHKQFSWCGIQWVYFWAPKAIKTVKDFRFLSYLFPINHISSTLYLSKERTSLPDFEKHKTKDTDTQKDMC